MKKLNISNVGRMPLLQKDLEFMTEDYRTFLQDMIGMLGFDNDCFIISGCRINDSDGKLSMTSGWAYYQGEILPVKELKEGNIQSQNNIYVKLNKKTHFDPSGSRMFQKYDGSSTYIQNIWQDNYLNPEVVYSAESPGFYIQKDPWTLLERIQQATTIHDSGWQKVQLKKEGEGFLFYRCLGNMVYLFGSWISSAESEPEDNVVLCNLPAPEYDAVFPTLKNETGSEYIVISTNGELKLTHVRPEVMYGFSYVFYFCKEKYIKNDSKTIYVP